MNFSGLQAGSKLLDPPTDFQHAADMFAGAFMSVGAIREDVPRFSWQCRPGFARCFLPPGVR